MITMDHCHLEYSQALPPEVFQPPSPQHCASSGWTQQHSLGSRAAQWDMQFDLRWKWVFMVQLRTVTAAHRHPWSRRTFQTQGTYKGGFSMARLKERVFFFLEMLSPWGASQAKTSSLSLKCLKLNARKKKLRVNLAPGMGPSVLVTQPAVPMLFFTELLYLLQGWKSFDPAGRQKNSRHSNDPK